MKWRKVVEWVKRYAPAEICGLSLSIFFAFLLNYYDQKFFTAFAATWGENFGFYGFIAAKDFFLNRRYQTFFKIFRGMIFEFGPAELLDSFITRPLSMYIFPKITGDLVLGIILGKIVADTLFYGPTIFLYEVKKKLNF